MGVYLEQSHALFNNNQRLDYGLEDIEKDGTRLNPFKTLSALMCTGEQATKYVLSIPDVLRLS